MPPHPSSSSGRSRSRGRASRDLRFAGRIAGFGTTSGTRIVLGLWETSPFGRFADAMIEDARGHRILLAPTDEVAAFIAATYAFDEVRVLPVARRRIDGGLALDASALSVRLRVGSVSPLGRVLRSVPPRLATHLGWLRAIDPVARTLQPGVRTAGSAGGGRREFYGVTLARRIVWAEARLDGADLGAFAELDPPVRFGFASAPREPHLVDVVTTIREPR
ncbi:hypothetical protein ACEXQE_01110 [Herbiconiux sp. P17]|uniref:hypothetical protein n=1 Tax=Herbiconiux wuyangfengii TaxID=3342794 RepID=UPI0035B6DEE4